MPEKFDIVFLGGGPAGYQGAIRAAQLGAAVAVIEEKFVGGVCLNLGCIPTKTVRASAEVGRALRRAKEYGFKPVEVVPEIASILDRKQRVIKGLRGSIERLFQAHRIELIEGRGRLVAPGKIEVQKGREVTRIEAARVVIATGSRPAGLPVFPKSPRVFPADEMLDISWLPQQLLVVGGGAVGVEMAAIFRELGSQVTLVETQGHILPNEDREMGDTLLSILQRRKIKVFCNIAVESATENEKSIDVQLSNGTTLFPDAVLLAIGRRFNTENIGLETLGIETEQGRIVVNPHLETNVAGHYAAGDVIGGWLLAHVAFAEGICAAEHAMGHGAPSMDYRVTPRCVFSIPEYAAVGLSYEQAISQCRVKVARFPFKSLGMAQALGELEGLVKIIVHADTEQILGAHIIGPHAADLVSAIALAMQSNLPARRIMETIHTHPTLSEAVLEAAQAIYKQAIHIPPEHPVAERS
ncbi:MAG: dihydrolipoyl dehydrogenase [Deltaproteobacteria bacterium]|nr:dihydrolipoyl dehydrogenase [Deltaproteobacteria bacterium]